MSDRIMAGWKPWEDLVDRGPAPVKAPEAPRPRSRDPRRAEAPKPRREDPENKLASYMTHELRAPLTSIRSALGLIEMSASMKMSDEERQTLALAVRNAERLDGLINDIMDFSKIRAGRLEMQPGAYSPFQLMTEAAESLRSWAVTRAVRVVVVESDEPLPRVVADRRRTVQVLINLLSNAIKFSPAGGRIYISATRGKHQHAGAVQFKVKDNGPGIPHEDLERVFQCFEQSALGAKTSGGTGLGLTLARAMIELQGGRIWAESWKGLGANFLFTLPIWHGSHVRPKPVYPEPVQYHGLLVGIYKRLNTIVSALFS